MPAGLVARDEIRRRMRDRKLQSWSPVFRIALGLALILCIFAPPVRSLASSHDGEAVREPAPRREDTCPGAGKEAERLVSAYAGAGRFSGTVLVQRGGETILRKGYGMEADAPLQIGSITKPFTALGILQLAERGKLDRHDSVSKHLPELSPLADDITLNHLLTHRSGLPDYIFSEAYETRIVQTEDPYGKLLKHLAGERPLFRPGTRFAYSNTNYALLGLILERVSGQPYEAYLKKNVLGPAGLTRTGVDRNDYENGQPRPGKFLNRDGEPEEAPDPDLSGIAGDGPLYSTADDLARFARFLRKREDGTGWQEDREGGRRRLHHGGRVPGFTGYVIRYPDEDAVVVVLSNLEEAPDQEMAEGLAKVMFCEPAAVPKYGRETAVAPARLDRLAGSYRLDGGALLRFRREGSHLYLSAEGEPETRLVPESETVFYSRHNGDRFSFRGGRLRVTVEGRVLTGARAR